jgi:hypothetical protein
MYYIDERRYMLYEAGKQQILRGVGMTTHFFVMHRDGRGTLA